MALCPRTYSALTHPPRGRVAVVIWHESSPHHVADDERSEVEIFWKKLSRRLAKNEQWVMEI